MGLFLAEMAGGLIFYDISNIFNFISALGVNSISFWFPAGYYLMAKKQYGKNSKESYVISSYVFIIFGIVNFIIGVTAAVLGILGISSGG